MRERRASTDFTKANRSTSRGVLRIVSYWEKLAGNSIALAAAVQLARMSTLDLVAPRARSSLIGALGEQAMPLQAYYDLGPLRDALAPRRLIDESEWATQLSATSPSRRTATIIVWSDFPRNCTREMGSKAGLARCPRACVSRVRRELYSSFTRETAGWPLSCLRSSVFNSALANCGRRGLRLWRRYGAVQVVNFRRHEDGKPLFPKLALLRAQRVRPAAAVHALASAFLNASGILNRPYVVMQLRSNHLAHEQYLAGGANCSLRVRECVSTLQRRARSLGRAAAVAAAAVATVSAPLVIASDVATLSLRSQDGDSHRRKPYFRRCLEPARPWLQTWYQGGLHFSCDDAARDAAARGQNHASFLGITAGACDAGVLGLVDIVLATEASEFVAVDARKPWPSAFVDWIVRRRRAAAKRSSLLRCRPHNADDAGAAQHG